MLPLAALIVIDNKKRQERMEAAVIAEVRELRKLKSDLKKEIANGKETP